MTVRWKMLRDFTAVLFLLLCVCTLKVRAGCPFGHDSPALPKQEGPKKTEKELIEERIRKIVSVTDTNEDGKSSVEEVSTWSREALMSVYKQDADNRLKALDTNEDGKVTWEEFLKSKEDIGATTEEQKRKRFNQADADKDGGLTSDEIISMFHPEERSHMFDVVVDEYIERGDSDKDGSLSFDEYESKMLKNRKENQKIGKQFFDMQDKDQDGKISRDEIKLWLESISTAGRAKKEAQMLVYHADDNKDGLLNEEEIMNHVNLFINEKEKAALKKEKEKAGNETAEEKAKDKSKDEL